MDNNSSKFTRPIRTRSDKGRRSWSTREEEVLIAAMKEIISSGWKSENGFRTGYLQALETIMVKHFPGTNLKATPHINSRLHVWKKNWSSLFSMMSKTGIGWSSKSKMIEATDDAWDSYIKVDPNARLMRWKPWPFYPDWCEIFGKDRATGASAEDFGDAANHVHVGENEQENELNEHFDRMFEGFDEQTEAMSVCQPQSSASGKKSSGKKRKSVNTPDPMCEIVNNFCENASSRLGDIAQRIGYEYDMSSARRKVFEFVEQMEGLTLQQKLRATKLVVQTVEDLDIFFSLPSAAKDEWTRMKLAGNL